MPRGREELQIRPVRVVHEQRHAARVTYLRERRYVLHAAEVVRGSYVNRTRPLARVQRPLQRLPRDGAGAEGGGGVGIEPHGLEPEQGAAVQEALVRVPGGENAVRRALGPEYVREMQHGLDALGASARRIERVARAEELRRVLLAFEDDALGAGEVVRARDFGYVERLAAELTAALVPRHVHPDSYALAVAPHKVADGRAHPSLSSSIAAWSMMAHSMRFLNRRQPYS